MPASPWVASVMLSERRRAPKATRPCSFIYIITFWKRENRRERDGCQVLEMGRGGLTAKGPEEALEAMAMSPL